MAAVPRKKTTPAKAKNVKIVMHKDVAPAKAKTAKVIKTVKVAKTVKVLVQKDVDQDSISEDSSEEDVVPKQAKGAKQGKRTAKMYNQWPDRTMMPPPNKAAR